MVTSQVGALPRIAPLFLFELCSPVHRTLAGYKAAVAPVRRAGCSDALAAVLAQWIDAHQRCLLGPGGRALLVPVPSSTGGRPSWLGRHPLEIVARTALAAGGPLRLESVLVTSRRPPGRLQADAAGYEVAEGIDVRGQAVVVLDDMLVSGARLGSAAAALRAAGGKVVAAVPLGRLVRPAHNAATAAFWKDRRHQPADTGRCLLCAGHASPPVSMATAAVTQRLAA